MMEVLHILVAEDDALIGILLVEMLEEMGHRVYAIETTQAGLQSAATRLRPQLMIVDLALGMGSGLVAVDAICRVGVIPHVYISGDISRVRRLRPNAVALQKPFREPDLVHAMQRALDAVI